MDFEDTEQINYRKENFTSNNSLENICYDDIKVLLLAKIV